MEENLRSTLLLHFFEIHRKRLTAIPLTSLFFGSIREFMAQMTATIGANNFLPDHAMRSIGYYLYSIFGIRRGETWPARVTFIFRRRFKNGIITGSAGIYPCFLVVELFSGTSSFCSFFAQDLILLRSQLFFPIFF